MRLCRFNDSRLGIVQNNTVYDVTQALEAIPAGTWPPAPGDPLILHLAAVRARAESLAGSAQTFSLASVTLHCFLTQPTKVIGAPVNYSAHISEAHADKNISFGRTSPPIAKIGLFLKANSCLAGPAEGVVHSFAGRRIDHEMELGVVIGKVARHVLEADALDYVAGYTIALDMTLRGEEDRTFRKSPDSFGIVGPWLVTADEIANPGALDIRLSVGGVVRQSSNTSKLIFGVGKLIELASQFYTLFPGDIIMTGTPAGVAPVEAGDVMDCEIEGVGRMAVPVHPEPLTPAMAENYEITKESAK